MEKTKSKSVKSKIQKQNKGEQKGEKRKVKKGQQWGNNGLVHLHVFAFILFSRFAFFLLLFCIYVAFCLEKNKKKQNKSKKQKQIEKTE
jgi:hypothetical protein